MRKIAVLLMICILLGSLTGCGGKQEENAEIPKMELGIPFEVNTECGTYVITMTGAETTDWWQIENDNTDKKVVLIEYEVENIDFSGGEQGYDGAFIDAQAFRVSDNNNHLLNCWNTWYSSEGVPDMVLPGCKMKVGLPYAVEKDTTSLEVVLCRQTGDVGKIVLQIE